MRQFWRRRRRSGPVGIELRQGPLQRRSIFASRLFRRGEIIEVSPFLRLAAGDKEAFTATALYSYYFLLSSHNDEIALGLGYTALYAHSAMPNAIGEIQVEKGLIFVRAVRDISSGREITINYNGDPGDPAPVIATAKEIFKEPFSDCIDSSHLYVADSPKKGRGIFASRAIAKGDLIERCPYLHFSAADYACISATRLTDYTFSIDKSEGTSALALGFGSLYNHAHQPNAVYYSDRDNGHMLFYADADIAPHTEICINYGGSSSEEGVAWFASRNIPCESV